MDNPLVTVCVVSYNALAFIQETLESIKGQTYKEIELIISDDASSDGTVEFCQKWIATNKMRFVDAKLITSEKNTGVTANCNRGLEVSHGKWWKVIGSDDILTVDCIESFVEYVKTRPEIKFIFGKQITFTGEFNSGTHKPQELPFRALFFRDSISAKKQYEIIVKLPQVGCAPTSFASTEILRSVGGFNPRFPMNEDTPLYIHLTSMGVKLWYLDEFVVYRRIHAGSIMHQIGEGEIIDTAGKRYVLGEWAAFLQENSNWIWGQMSRFSNFLSMQILKNGNDWSSFKCRFWYYCRQFLNPYRWYVLWARIKDRLLTILGY